MSPLAGKPRRAGRLDRLSMARQAAGSVEGPDGKDRGDWTFQEGGGSDLQQRDYGDVGLPESGAGFHSGGLSRAPVCRARSGSCHAFGGVVGSDHGNRLQRRFFPLVSSTSRRSFGKTKACFVPEFRAGIRLELNLQDGLPLCIADASQFMELLLQLLTNAGEAIGGKPGGSMEIATTSRVIDESSTQNYLGYARIEPGNYVCLRIRDSGAGIDHRTQRRMFDPFFSTKNGSRGMGLAMVLEILRNHKGGVQVESAPGPRQFLYGVLSGGLHRRTSPGGEPRRSAYAPPGRVQFFAPIQLQKFHRARS